MHEGHPNLVSHGKFKSKIKLLVPDGGPCLHGRYNSIMIMTSHARPHCPRVPSSSAALLNIALRAVRD